MVIIYQILQQQLLVELVLLLEQILIIALGMLFLKQRTVRPPKYAGLDKVNPSSVILSGVMMLEHIGWKEAAVLIELALETAIYNKRVTYDFERLMDGATLLKCSEFGDEIISNF